MKKRNYKYQKGVRKERKIVNEFRERGCIALRSAGSHSPIDVVVVDRENKEIFLIQCKSESFRESQVKELVEKYKDLSGEFKVYFWVE